MSNIKSVSNTDNKSVY